MGRNCHADKARGQKKGAGKQHEHMLRVMKGCQP